MEWFENIIQSEKRFLQIQVQTVKFFHSPNLNGFYYYFWINGNNFLLIRQFLILLSIGYGKYDIRQWFDKMQYKLLNVPPLFPSVHTH